MICVENAEKALSFIEGMEFKDFQNDEKAV